MRIRVLAAVALATVLAPRSAAATPIVYKGALFPAAVATGVNTQQPGEFDVLATGDFWFFQATAGANVEIIGDRQAADYDMAFWIFEGLYTDTAALPSLTGPQLVNYYDDEDAPNLLGSLFTFGDPHASFVAPKSGMYTVIVTNNLSEMLPPNPYSLTAANVHAMPEPASVLLLGFGLTALAYWSRRR